MKCADCPYYYVKDNEESEACHYPWDDNYAPCELDEPEETEDIDEAYNDCGFDPYLGCYTDDC